MIFWKVNGSLNFSFGRFYLSKRMDGDSRPGSDLGSRMSVFSGDQEEMEILIAGGRKAARRNTWPSRQKKRIEPGVREGIYTATLMYLMSHGNESSGPKLNCIEPVKRN